MQANNLRNISVLSGICIQIVNETSNRWKFSLKDIIIYCETGDDKLIPFFKLF